MITLIVIALLFLFPNSSEAVTSKPAVTTTATRTASTLSYGSRNAAVVLLQQQLISLGYLAADSATGYFGNLTRAAVRKFQCAELKICSGSEIANGWGTFGPRTRAAINASLAMTPGVNSATTVTSTAVTGTQGTNGSSGGSNTNTQASSNTQQYSSTASVTTTSTASASTAAVATSVTSTTSSTVAISTNTTTTTATTVLTEYVFYVDGTNGSDSNSGTAQSPFKTLSKAKLAVKTALASQKLPTTVYIVGGQRYYLSESLVFGAQDAPAGATVTWTAKPGTGIPEISGGKQIPQSAWTLEGWGTNVYKASNEYVYSRQLYTGIDPLTRARYPNVSLSDASSGLLLSQYTDPTDPSTGQIVLPKGVFQSWMNIGYGNNEDPFRTEMVLPIGWGLSRLRVLAWSEDSQNTYVSFFPKEAAAEYLKKTPTRTGAYGPFHLLPQKGYVDGNPRFIDQDREWATVPSQFLTYVQLANSAQLADIVAPKLDTLIRIDGAQNLTIKNLRFVHTNFWDAYENGYVGYDNIYRYQANAGVLQSLFDYPAPAAVEVINSSGIKFEQVAFSALGATGLSVYDSSGITVTGSNFKDISNTAIAVLNSNNVSIRENSITNTGFEFGGAGISVLVGENVAHTTSVSNNTISNVGGVGVAARVPWKTTGQPNVTVERNTINGAMRMIADQGAIYVTGTVAVKDNTVTNIVKSGWNTAGGTVPAIYLDIYSMNSVVSGNTVTGSADALTLNCQVNNTISNNNFSSGSIHSSFKYCYKFFKNDTFTDTLRAAMTAAQCTNVGTSAESCACNASDSCPYTGSF